MSNQPLFATLRCTTTAVFPFREFAELGGLMSYRPNLPEMFRTAATDVDKIRSNRLSSTWSSISSAKALGIDMTATLLARADDCEFSGQYLFETSI
jgi:putative tryptophan/tyrosine transport system substrate-binding protein